SSEVLLKNLPNLISLSLSGNRFPFSSVLFVIVRNLYILKIFSFLPGRACLNITGEPSLNFTKMAIRIINGNNNIIAIKDTIKSNTLLKKYLYIKTILLLY